jgi:hypothetical protein
MGDGPKPVTRKRGLLRETWFSICSRHFDHDPACDLCTTGHWMNDTKRFVTSKVFKYSPKLWRIMANLPSGKKSFLNFEKYSQDNGDEIKK